MQTQAETKHPLHVRRPLSRPNFTLHSKDFKTSFLFLFFYPLQDADPCGQLFVPKHGSHTCGPLLTRLVKSRPSGFCDQVRDATYPSPPHAAYAAAHTHTHGHCCPSNPTSPFFLFFLLTYPRPRISNSRHPTLRTKGDGPLSALPSALAAPATLYFHCTLLPVALSTRVSPHLIPSHNPHYPCPPNRTLQLGRSTASTLRLLL